jgi:hypothetical protein
MNFLRFISIFSILFVAFFAKSNAEYKPVLGLEAKEKTLEDEKTQEIIIKKRKVASYSGNNSLFLTSKKENYKFYGVFGYNNQIKTQVSSTAFGNLQDLGFATPFKDRRFGTEIFLGMFLDKASHFSGEIGLEYNMSYFENKENKEFAIHSIAPSTRLIYDFFPQDKFSIYVGGSLGLAIMDLIVQGEYKVNFAPQIGGLTGVSYRINKPISLFLGYKILYTPETKFDFSSEKSYKTDFIIQNLTFGMKIKF